MKSNSSYLIQRFLVIVVLWKTYFSPIILLIKDLIFETPSGLFLVLNETISAYIKHLSSLFLGFIFTF